MSVLKKLTMSYYNMFHFYYNIIIYDCIYKFKNSYI